MVLSQKPLPGKRKKGAGKLPSAFELFREVDGLGDDVTDEDAFRAIAHHGVGVVVQEADAPSAAGYALQSPEEVIRWLWQLTEFLEHQAVWTFGYDGFDPQQEPLREALCPLGNGYFGTRGAAPESTADDVHYPGIRAKKSGVSTRKRRLFTKA